VRRSTTTDMRRLNSPLLSRTGNVSARAISWCKYPAFPRVPAQRLVAAGFAIPARSDTAPTEEAYKRNRRSMS